jgi:hypothetical protein
MLGLSPGKGIPAGYEVETEKSPPTNVISTVLNSPIVAEITGSSAKNAPCKIKPGSVGDATPLVGFTVIVVVVPTSAASVA